MVLVVDGSARRLEPSGGNNDVHSAADELDCQRRQAIRLTFRPSVFHRDGAALRESGFRKSLPNERQTLAVGRRRRAAKTPITGIAFCCARATSGHPTAALPSSVMNSPPVHSITSSAWVTQIGNGHFPPQATAMAKACRAPLARPR